MRRAVQPVVPDRHERLADLDEGLNTLADCLLALHEEVLLGHRQWSLLDEIGHDVTSQPCSPPGAGETNGWPASRHSDGVSRRWRSNAARVRNTATPTANEQGDGASSGHSISAFGRFGGRGRSGFGGAEGLGVPGGTWLPLRMR